MSTLAINRHPNRVGSALLLLLFHSLQIVRDGEAFNHRAAVVGATSPYHFPAAAGHMDAWPCAFACIFNAPRAWRQHCFQKAQPLPARARRCRKAVFCKVEERAGAGSTEGPSAGSSQSPPEQESPEEVQYGFWAPASKELQVEPRVPVSETERFGGDATASSEVRRCSTACYRVLLFTLLKYKYA